MAYKVIITDQAQQDFSSILEFPHPKFTLPERVVYVEELKDCCFKLEYMPKRFRREWFNGVEYRVRPFKGHLIIYRVDDFSGVVSIVTIRGGPMDAPRGAIE